MILAYLYVNSNGYVSLPRRAFLPQQKCDREWLAHLRVANTEANLKPILEQLAKLDDPKVVAMMEELPELQNEETRIRNEVAELTSRSDQLRRASDTGGEITVRVLDGQPDK